MINTFVGALYLSIELNDRFSHTRCLCLTDGKLMKGKLVDTNSYKNIVLRSLPAPAITT